MAKLKMLGARVSTLNTQRAPALTTATRRITGSRLQKIRERILRRANGLCECADCRAPGVVPLLAEEIDHLTPLWENGADTDDAAGDANRVALSKACHARKSAIEAKRRAQAGK
jgi:5-methylcytosine-specific restriction protein A